MPTLNILFWKLIDQRQFYLEEHPINTDKMVMLITTRKSRIKYLFLVITIIINH